MRVETKGIPRATIDPDKNNSVPRIGLAWRPLTSDRFVVRAAHGVFYSGSVRLILAHRGIAGSTHPILEPQAGKQRKIQSIRRNQDKIIDLRDRSDLAVYKGSLHSDRLQPCPFIRMPFGR